MPITSGFNHVATLTTDLDRFTAWYGKVFDAEVVFEMQAEGDHPRMAIVDLGGGGALNVFEVDEASLIGDRRRIGGRGAIDHIGADIGEIQNLGGDTWSLFFRDVDGMELEVCAPVSPAAR
jgi:catechol 2,3-dioxygenase-like lactoylglutathione lyase family enzyme